jgi:hypothetical protein
MKESEAINAFCHRDYRDPDYVQVAIFKDRALSMLQEKRISERVGPAKGGYWVVKEK